MTLDLEKLIIDVFDPQPGENVVLMNDFPTDRSQIDQDYQQRRKMVNEWHAAFVALAWKKGFTVEDVITYEPTGANSAPLPETAWQGETKINLNKKLASLGERDIVVAIARYSPTAPIFSLQEAGQRFRGATMPGATMEMQAFQADYTLVAEKAKILADELTKATYAKVTFATGHTFYFDLRGNRKAHADGGQCQTPGQGINLPSGEGYKAPYEGLDDILGPSLTKGKIPVMIGEELVIYEVEKGMIVDVWGEGPEAQKMRDYFEEDPIRRYIAELGLGCNEKAVLCGKILQDEKIEGFHWAFGQSDHLGGAITRAMFKSDKTVVHQDTIYSANAPIGVTKIVLGNAKGEKTIMRDSKYLPILGAPFSG